MVLHQIKDGSKMESGERGWHSPLTDGTECTLQGLFTSVVYIWVIWQYNTCLRVHTLQRKGVGSDNLSTHNSLTAVWSRTTSFQFSTLYNYALPKLVKGKCVWSIPKNANSVINFWIIRPHFPPRGIYIILLAPPFSTTCTRHTSA